MFWERDRGHVMYMDGKKPLLDPDGWKSQVARVFIREQGV